jgi:predicted Ser/Thr protein kinase
MKPLFKPKKELTKTQKELMKEHRVHHTKKHMDMMKKLMLEGYCFQQAHNLTMKKVGK